MLAPEIEASKAIRVFESVIKKGRGAGERFPAGLRRVLSPALTTKYIRVRKHI